MKTSKRQDKASQKARREAQKASKKAKSMPMNKNFLEAVNEDGTPMYPEAIKLNMYTMLNYDSIYDLMRQISAYIVQIKHHQNRIKRLTEQYNGEVQEHDEFGRKYKREEIQLMINSEKIAIPRDLDKIREYLVHKLMPMIDEVRLTGAKYNEFLLHVKTCVERLGYELFPENLELIFPEFE